MQLSGEVRLDEATHTSSSLLLAAESTLNRYASLTPGFSPPHLHLCLGLSSTTFVIGHYMKSVCELWVRKSPSEETSMKTHSHLVSYLYSRGRNPQQNSLPEWICLVINLESLGREEQHPAPPGNPPLGLLPTGRHHPFHGSLHREALSLDGFGSMVLIP